MRKPPKQRRRRSTRVAQHTSSRPVFALQDLTLQILSCLSRTELYRAMLVEKTWHALAMQPGLEAWSYLSSGMSYFHSGDDDDIPDVVDKLILNRFAKLRHFHLVHDAEDHAFDWELCPVGAEALIPKSVQRLCVRRVGASATYEEEDEKTGSAQWLKSMVEALPTVRELRLAGFFFCEVGACLQTVGLHTIFLQQCIVSDETLSVIATHSADTLQRLVLFETSSYENTDEGLYTDSGVRSILQSCHQLKHLELGGGHQWKQKERITHKAWNSTGVVCCVLETLCLGNQHTDDASVTAIMTLFPGLQNVAIKMNREQGLLGFPSLLALARLPQLRHLDLRRMGRGLCLSKSCIQALAPALGRIESFSAEIRENERDAYESLFRRLCSSPHLTDLTLIVPVWVRFPGRGMMFLGNEPPLMPNWLADEPTHMQYPYTSGDLWEDSE